LARFSFEGLPLLSGPGLLDLLRGEADRPLSPVGLLGEGDLPLEVDLRRGGLFEDLRGGDRDDFLGGGRVPFLSAPTSQSNLNFLPSRE